MSTWRQLKDNPKNKEIFIKRAEIIKIIREFFWQENFIETDTPIANSTGGQEPYLEPIKTEFVDPRGQIFKQYLQTSPEYAMKKLLAGGFEKIFQICHCFRNNESFGGTHYPEFLMLEWYRVGDDYLKIMDDTENLFNLVAEKMEIDFLFFNNKKISIKEKWDRLTMREVWQKYLGVELNDYLTLSAMMSLAKSRGLTIDKKDLYEDVFYKIFLNEIEPKLGMDRPVFIYEYPASMAALARLSGKDPRYAERFELYIGGLELANAFGELIDGEEQKHRFAEEQNLRQELDREVCSVDEGLIDALNFLKNKKVIASGIALGVDRLIMLFTGVNDILETRLES